MSLDKQEIGFAILNGKYPQVRLHGAPFFQ